MHVVFPILHGPEEHGIGDIDHLRHPAPCRPEKDALAFGGAVDDVVGRVEKLAACVFPAATDTFTALGQAMLAAANVARHRFKEGSAAGAMLLNAFKGSVA